MRLSAGSTSAEVVASDCVRVLTFRAAPSGDSLITADQLPYFGKRSVEAALKPEGTVCSVVPVRAKVSALPPGLRFRSLTLAGGYGMPWVRLVVTAQLFRFPNSKPPLVKRATGACGGDWDRCGGPPGRGASHPP